MRVVECEQLSPIWWEARRGKATSSNFHRILTPKTQKLAAAADEYVFELIADLVRLDPPVLIERPMTPAMRNGVTCEPEARKFYEMHRNVDVQQVGCCISDNGFLEASPDGLVGEDGLLELKCPEPKTHVKYLLNGGLPDEYRCQCHGQLIVTGRKWVDFLSYCPGFSPLLVRVEPDDFTEALRRALGLFQEKYQAAWEQFQKVNA